jgi:hypothetical protein
VDAVAYEDAVALWNKSAKVMSYIIRQLPPIRARHKQNYLPPTFKLILQVYSIPARANAKMIYALLQ